MISGIFGTGFSRNVILLEIIVIKHINGGLVVNEFMTLWFLLFDM